LFGFWEIMGYMTRNLVSCNNTKVWFDVDEKGAQVICFWFETFCFCSGALTAKKEKALGKKSGHKKLIEEIKDLA
jgi:hypothetical protein